MTFKILAIGDVIGKPGRSCLSKLLPLARQRFSPDIVLANGENAAGGFGITKKIYQQFIENFGIDCITMGNHWHDKPEVHSFAPQAERMILPANMMNVDRLDAAYRILKSQSGHSYAVINLIGRAFMHPDNRDFFVAIKAILAQIPDNCKIRIVDFHGEATSEKQGIAQFLKGTVSLCYGTHSHVPTADERILADFTGFTTDIGMTGPYDSVIGIRAEAALHRMQTGQKGRFEPASEDLWLCFIVAEVDPATGRCVSIQRHRWEWEIMKHQLSPTSSNS